MTSILIIDGGPDSREHLAEELAFAGYTVMTTANAERAREIIRLSRPKLVMLDAHVKGHYGFDLLLSIRKEDPSLPILFISDFPSNRANPLLAPAEGYLIKDLPVGPLKQTIREILERKPARPAGGGAKGVSLRPGLIRNLGRRSQRSLCAGSSFH